MARALSNHLLKGITVSPAGYSNRMLVSALSIQRGMRYSTTVPNDPDTHDDFKPLDKFQDSATSLMDVVEQDVKENPVMIVWVQLSSCKSIETLHLLTTLSDVLLSARNILENAELKSAVKAFSHWPTFPQIFIKGEFIGGSDIILSMHQSGELKDIAANQEKSA